MVIKYCQETDDRIKCKDCANFTGRTRIAIRRVMFGEETKEYYNTRRCRLFLGACPDSLRRCKEFVRTR